MIARVRILLPYSVFVPVDEELKPIKIHQDGIEITLYPLLQSGFDAGHLTSGKFSLNEIAENIKPLYPPVASQDTLLNGKEMLRCNLLQIDLKKDVFNRTIGQTDNVPLEMAFEIANSFLLRLRTVTQAAYVKPLDADPAPWLLEFLSDDEKPLEPEPGKFRKKNGAFFKVRASALTEGIWEKINSLPLGFKPAAYDRLLLDAEAMLSDLGPAIVLAFSALETLIPATLRALVQQTNANSELWEWIQSRNDDYNKEPSVSEEFDVLLKALSGVSLKDNQHLWQAFQNLRSARNNFVHNGVLGIGKEGKIALSKSDVWELIGKAKEIVSFVENLLPEDLRRPIGMGKFEWSHTHSIVKPVLSSTAESPKSESAGAPEDIPALPNRNEG
jgi:hypothetical protein